MQDWWNNADVIGAVSAWSQIIVAIAGVAALIFGFRSASLGDQRIAELELSAGEANKLAGEANERAAGLEKETAVANLELERLRSSVDPRRITTAQAMKIAEVVRGKVISAIGFTYESSVNDSKDLAGQLATILGDAGCTISWQFTAAVTYPPGQGLLVSFTEPQKAEGEILVDALRAAGFEVETGGFPGSFPIEVTVGTR